jgi:hypothetical protein
MSNWDILEIIGISICFAYKTYIAELMMAIFALKSPVHGPSLDRWTPFVFLPSQPPPPPSLVGLWPSTISLGPSPSDPLRFASPRIASTS